MRGELSKILFMEFLKIVFGGLACEICEDGFNFLDGGLLAVLERLVFYAVIWRLFLLLVHF